MKYERGIVAVTFWHSCSDFKLKPCLGLRSLLMVGSDGAILHTTSILAVQEDTTL